MQKREKTILDCIKLIAVIPILIFCGLQALLQLFDKLSETSIDEALFLLIIIPSIAFVLGMTSFFYLPYFYKQKKKKIFDFVMLFVALSVMTLCGLQLVSACYYCKGSMALYGDSAAAYYAKAGKYSPIALLKGDAYTLAAWVYRNLSPKETFDKNKLYEYMWLSAKYNEITYWDIVLWAEMFGDYDIALDAVKKQGSDYLNFNIGRILILKKEYEKALPYIEESLKNCKEDKCFGIYIARAIIYKNLGDDENANKNYEFAKKCINGDEKRIIRYDNAVKNYKTYYEDVIASRKKWMMKDFESIK